MYATTKDLRFHTKEILDKSHRGEEVIITYHGKPYAKIIPLNNDEKNNRKNDFMGMWKDRDDIDDVEDYVREIRKGRF